MDITEETSNGFLILSTIHDGFLVRQKYQGYTKAAAKKKFKQHLKSLDDEKI